VALYLWRALHKTAYTSNPLYPDFESREIRAGVLRAPDPKGTEIPNGLIIVKDSYSKKYQATHYSLSPNYTMPQTQFKLLLDRLARNAIARATKVSSGGA
jgi:hypothetical protein